MSSAPQASRARQPANGVGSVASPARKPDRGDPSQCVIAFTAFLMLLAGHAVASEATLDAILEPASDGLARGGVSGRCAPALDRYRVIVGCSPDSSARIYRRVNGIWQEEQRLTPSDPADPGAISGASVIKGRTAAVAGRNDAADQGSESGGAVYVFRRTNGTWRQEAKLTASDWVRFKSCDGFEIGNNFGSALAIDGNRLAVGARTDCDPSELAGAVYVFRRASDGTWIEEAKLVGTDVRSGDQFGWSVSIDGPTIVAGGPLAFAGGKRIGSAYVFHRNGRRWTEQQKLSRAGTLAAEDFGISVAVEGNQILVGANRDNDSGDRSGSVYAYESIGGTWNQTQKLLADDGRFSDRFGTAVSLSGSRALIGAIGDDDNVPNSGSAYLFDRDGGGTWQQAAKLTAPEGRRKDEFGDSVGLSGHRALILAPGHEPNGSAYVYSLRVDSAHLNVKVDLEPGKPRNRIDPTRQLRFRVAVFSSPAFDALQIDLQSVQLLPGGAAPTAHRVNDRNADGLPDLVLLFDSAGAGFACGESTVELVGQTAAGASFSGSDSVTNTGCR